MDSTHLQGTLKSMGRGPHSPSLALSVRSLRLKLQNAITNKWNYGDPERVHREQLNEANE